MSRLRETGDGGALSVEPGGLRSGRPTWVDRTLFRKPSENEGAETQQRRCLISLKIDVPNILIFGTLGDAPVLYRRPVRAQLDGEARQPG